ncbi:beta-glucosidase H [Aspergillus mulundensis]|uniref:beta-glucosidase n=1 Tax=Aspergillus mulundensis TaxID=1810919 RepID=A0A3D8QIT7_9EURO|nr:Beta-glucosidase [Aspergillus mulundensis]RDW61743.1 Beta-glucosidase [Aspergillus mulundensis]
MGDASMRNMSAAEYAASMLPQLTLEEKVKLLAGADMWRTNAIPRVGISQMKCSDGPVGVRGGQFTDGVTAASLPSGVSLASTWDPELIDEMSTILIAECRSKSIDVLLGPTVCIPRTPLGGRNFEAYSEDPFLSGKLAARYIKGIQEAGIATCIKHFAANDQEHRRFFVDAQISERALREIHTQPFEIAVRESNPWSLMTAYNKVNGSYASANKHLLRDILREEWGWDGVAMSDWFGTNTVVPSVEYGLDLEMPGPVKRRGKHLIEAHKQGLISEARIDECATRMLKLLHRVGKSSEPDWKEPGEKAVDLPEHRAIMRRCAAEGIVLLKNEKNVLPLDIRPAMRIAVIGPNAGRAVQSGGGSSDLLPHYRTIPLDAIKQAVDEAGVGAEVAHAPGMQGHRYIPLMSPTVMRNPVTGESGWVLSFWANMDHSGDIVYEEHRKSSILVCYDTLPESLTTGERYSYRGRTILTPKTTGKHWFSLSSCGPGRLLLDGKVILDIPRRWWSPKSPLFMSYGSPEERVQIHLEAGRQYELTLDGISREPEPYEFSFTGDLLREEIQDGGRVGFLEEETRDLMSEAVDLAAKSDLVIMVVGKDREWESETSDMVSMNLPKETDLLISNVAQVNQNTIVVNQTGSPIAMPWLSQVRAVVQAWYQGQEHANALTDVLFGRVNPCGKLPITFPRVYEQNPSSLDYPGHNDRVVYGEGIFAGYRWWDRLQIEPLFPFGFGISYSTFEYSNTRVSATELQFSEQGSESIEVTVDVTNTSDVVGKEIVQFYVSPKTAPRLTRPKRELKGWNKMLVRPGETVTASAILDWVSIAYWDDKRHEWVVDGGAVFEVIAARHSRDIGVVAEFQVGKPAANLRSSRFTVLAD